MILNKLLKVKSNDGESIGPRNLLNGEKLDKFLKTGYWYQRIDIGNGIYTMEVGPAFHEMVWEKFSKVFPKNMKGVTVLDIGTNAGYFPIEFKKRGAGKVVGMEFVEEFIKQAEEIKRIYDLKDVEYLKLDAHEVDKVKGFFDVVVFTGILYHLKNPLQVIEDVGKKCKDVILIETEAIPQQPEGYVWARQGCPPKLEKCTKGYMKFFESTSLNNDGSNWWAPDTECLKGMLRTAGFKYFSKPYFIAETRLMLVATKEENSLVDLNKF
jgi:tRNA (mo5U34)-methyltransferase